MTDRKRFQRNLRVSPACFLRLEEKLSAHHLSVRYQLAIARYRFGHEGSASSCEAVAQWAGVSAGIVDKAIRRVMRAVLSFHDEAIRWTTNEEKEQAKSWPHHFGESYFDRKSNYSLKVQRGLQLLTRNLSANVQTTQPSTTLSAG
ncbi:hypothetical protein FN846DRAFT_898948 [Sphaerosporella brunnea]|uniref:Uncharacterized protein n=1 Tax=Sphaerosporella brunnea TaxID=1250544 RepID=A0A5J5EXU5_9PEZI|nr:hypothetical protein FN846DRAFT_898948 [Sphaerosporella brunnea]